MVLVVVVAGVSTTLPGQDLRIVDVVRRGPPPYAEQDRLYRIEGGDCRNLKVGCELLIQGEESNGRGAKILVCEVGDSYVLGRLIKQGASYPLKGDRLRNLGDPRVLAPLPAISVVNPVALEIVNPPKVLNEVIGTIFFKVGDSTLSPKGKEKLKAWVDARGPGGRWHLSLVPHPSEPKALNPLRVLSVQAELRSLGVQEVDEASGPTDASGELPGICLTRAATGYFMPGATPLPPSRSVKVEAPVLAEPAAPVARPDLTIPVTGTSTSGFRGWSIGLVRQIPKLSGNYSKTDGISKNAFDFGKDFHLTPASLNVGLSLEHNGPRFLFRAGLSALDFKGHSVLDRDVYIDTTTHHQGEDLQSEVRLRNFEVSSTYKFWRPENGFLGVDVGVNYWDARATAAGPGTLQSDPSLSVVSHTSASIHFPAPQLGLTAGFDFQDRFSGRAYFHFMSLKGTQYKRFGLDLRYFPFKRLGLQLNFDREEFSTPPGSSPDSTTLHLDKTGSGLGFILRL